jgi:DNA-binding NarL/FixJ family response regulator
MQHPSLSAAECEVLRLIAKGLSDRQIAAQLRKSLRTIHAHRDHLFDKTGSSNRVILTRFAISAGYVPFTWSDEDEDRDHAMT